MTYHLHTQNDPRGPVHKVLVPDGLMLRDDGGIGFEIKEPIMPGGNGVVFRALRYGPRRDYLGQCAVKMLKQLSTARIDRFNNEVRVMKSLAHPRIAALHGSGAVVLDPNVVPIPWAAMQLGGPNLRQHVLEHGPLDVATLRRLLPQIVDATKALHAVGFLHRDLKPDNFVWSDRNKTDVTMIDFGIAKRIGEDVSGRPLDEFTRTLEFVGPQFYSSPELIAYARDKAHPVDQRSDLFQLGKVMWFLATGDVLAGIPSKRRDPFEGPLHALVSALISEDPNDRPESADAVAQRLATLD